MRWQAKLGRRIGWGLLAISIILGAVFFWLMPVLIRARVSAFYAGRVSIEHCSVGFGPITLSGVVLSETGEARTTEWLAISRLETDLTLQGILTGRVRPTSIKLFGAKARIRLARNGEVLTRAALNPSANDAKATLPEIVLIDASASLEQEGHAPFQLGSIGGTLSEGNGGLDLHLRSSEPSWGPLRAEGQIARTFKSGHIQITTPADIIATPERARSLPFIPLEVWSHLKPDGPIGLDIALDFDQAATPSFRYLAIANFHQSRLKFATLGLTTQQATGQVRCDGPLVHVENFECEAIGGRIQADGTLDFRSSPAQFDLKLGLDGIDVEKSPPAWQLSEIGASGKLIGRVHMLANVAPNNIDLTGSSGDARIENGMLQGFPVKLIKLSMKAKGGDLQYESKNEGKGTGFLDRFRPILPIWVTVLQAQQAKIQPPKIELPKSITTQLVFEDLDLAKVIERVETLTRIKVPVRIAGKASLRARATIPLGSIRDIKQYKFQGQAKLVGADIDGVDLGRIDCELTLDDGVLRLKDLRGQLLDRPAGSEIDPPQPVDPVPLTGALPTGGFRGAVTVEISPPGRLTAAFDGEKLPVGELTAPFLPRPTPLAGSLTTKFKAEAPVTRWESPDAWTVDGTLQSERVAYRAARLDQVSTSFQIKQGKLTLPDADARLDGNPLKLKGSIGLAGKRAFEAKLEVKDWDLAKLLPFFPSMPSPAHTTGRLSITADVDGGLNPPSVRTTGEARLTKLLVEGLPFGDVPIRWRTERDEIVLQKVEAHPFGGTLVAEGRIPSSPVRPARLAVTLDSVNMSPLVRAISGPKGEAVVGTLNGRLTLLKRPESQQLEVDSRLQIPSLNVNGVALGPAVLTAQANAGSLVYQFTLDGPDGLVRFNGALPLKALGDAKVESTDARLTAVGYTLGDLAKIAKLGVIPSGLRGQVGLDANLRFGLTGTHPIALQGNIEARNLVWDQNYPIGRLRGIVARTPEVWQLDQISGEFFGGPVSGAVWSEPIINDQNLVRFELKIDRAELSRVLAFAPDLAKQVTGYASLALNGRYDKAASVTGDLFVPKAHFLGLPILDLRIPIDLTLEGDGSTGTLRARRFSGRASGGNVRGDASMRVGPDRSFNVAIDLSNVDLETITRIQSTNARPGSGKVSGKITLNGPDPAVPMKYRGRMDLGLDDASIVDIPLVREIDRFLGAARGGLIEKGEMHAAIANRQMLIEGLTLEGRLIQAHASGVVNMDGGVALEVLVNTNQIIPETGQALLALIPGLGDLGRNEQAAVRFGGFLSNRLLKFRISGTVKNPIVQLDPAVAVTSSAIGFFGGALKLPLDLIR